MPCWVICTAQIVGFYHSETVNYFLNSNLLLKPKFRHYNLNMNVKYPGFIFYVLMFFFASALEASEAPEFVKTIAEIKQKINKFDVGAHRRRMKSSSIPGFSGKLLKLDKQIEHLQGALIEKIKSVAIDIASLGEKKSTDPWKVKEKRQKLMKRKSQLEGMEKESKVYLLKIKELQKHLVLRLKQVQAEQLFAKSDPLHKLLWGEPQKTTVLFKSLGSFFSSKANHKSISPIYLIYSLLIAFGVYIVMHIVRWRLLRNEYFQRASSAQGGAPLKLIRNFIVYLPGMMLALTSLSIMDVTGYEQKLYLFSRFAMVMLTTLLILPFMLTMVNSIKMRNGSPQDYGLNIHMKILVYVTGIGFFVNSVFKESGLEINTLFILYDFTLLTMLVFYYFSISYFVRCIHFIFAAMVRVIAVLFAVTIIVIAFKGYRNLSFYLLQIVTGMFVLSVAYFMLNNMLSYLNGGIIKRVTRFNISPEVTILKTARFWIVFLLRVTLFFGLIYTLLHLLGFHDTLEKQLDIWIYKGFAIGSMSVVPSKILLAILAFASLHSLSGWIKAKLDSKWLNDIGMERSAKEALVTMGGYVGIVIASLLALGIIGVSFTSLAIIAGALSVGIGFGLQNIVNNFISGLILLFERPIKTGDWIVVGDVEGYVKRISIRSTIIQTFERADVIVPNAELITTKVTNWMYRDRRGRVNVPIGVAYGSNVQQVIELLTKVAEQHDQVITENPMFPIRVIMLGFGDNALEFELRCFINDIDRRVSVNSELNIAVELVLREAAIEIPFPQRDVHMIEPSTK